MNHGIMLSRCAKPFLSQVRHIAQQTPQTLPSKYQKVQILGQIRNELTELTSLKKQEVEILGQGVFAMYGVSFTLCFGISFHAFSK